MAKLAAGSAHAGPPRRPTNVTLSESLLSEARELAINVSAACEQGLAAQVAQARRTRWLRQNMAAMTAWNEHVAIRGVPLAAFRQF